MNVNKKQLTANALGCACLTAVYISTEWSGEFAFVCLFFSVWDLSSRISVSLLLCFEVKKINEITEAWWI